jgi:hypothetical protein
MVTREKFHEACKILKEKVKNGQHKPYLAICHNLTHVLDEPSYHLVGKYSKSWKYYSGNYSFPVPGPNGESGVDAFKSQWNLWTGEYGELRKELLDHLIHASRETIFMKLKNGWFRSLNK